MVATETFVPGRLYEMPLAGLHPEPNQPRKYLGPTGGPDHHPRHLPGQPELRRDPKL
jgi:hypothetical protein